jgi:adenylate cyclase, class 2
MAPHQEIEIKFCIAAAGALSRRLRASGFRLLTKRTHEINTVYDFAGSPLFKRGELLRLRKYGREWVLTHKAKGTTGRHKSRVETETKISDGARMHGILLALGLTPTFRYEKFRAEWSDGRGRVVIDETPIGTFGEIEGRSRWIDQTAAALRIRRSDYITQSYAELFFDWKTKKRHRASEMTFAAVSPERTRR